ncbi:MAG: FliG C-terminal domain-containing protein [Planctomycetaceae bacterium]
MDDWRSNLARIVALINGMNPRQRLGVAAFGLLVVGALGLLLNWRNGADLVALRNGKLFAAKDLRAAQATLQNAGLTQFRVDGGRILVPQAELPRYMAALEPPADRMTRPQDAVDKALEDVWLLSVAPPRHQQAVLDNALKKELENELRKFDEIEDPHLIIRPAPRGLRAASRLTALLTFRWRDATQPKPEVVETMRGMVCKTFDMRPADVMISGFHEARRPVTLPQRPAGPEEPGAATMAKRPAAGVAATREQEPKKHPLDQRLAGMLQMYVRRAANHWASPLGVAGLSAGALWMMRRRLKSARGKAQSKKPGQPGAVGELAAARPDSQAALSQIPVGPDGRNGNGAPAAVAPVTPDAAVGGDRTAAKARLAMNEQRSPAAGVAAPLHATAFAFLHGFTAERLASMIGNEHPQTIAVVLSHLPADLAAETLASFSEARQHEVARRIAQMQPVSLDVVRDIENSLERRIAALDAPSHVAHGIATLARMLDASGPRRNEALLAQLGQSGGTIQPAGRVAPAFDEQLLRNEGAIQGVVEHVAPGMWVLALTGASSEVKQLVLQRLPGPYSAEVRDQLDEWGPVRISDVETAQRHILSLLHQSERSVAGRRAATFGRKIA